jgi:hypothetical protein
MVSAWTDEDRHALAEACREHDRMMEEAREPVGEPYVMREASMALEYRVTDNNALAAAPPPFPTASRDEGWNSWWRESWSAHVEDERKVVAEAIGNVAFELKRELQAEYEAALVERDQKIAELRGQNIEIQGLLGRTLKQVEASTTEIAELRRRLDSRDERDRTYAERSGRIAELQRENAVARREADRSQLEAALTENRARVERIETKLGMLLNFIGGDLPRGFGA